MKESFTQNNFYGYLLVLLSLFIVLFFTRNFYSDLQVTIDATEQSNIELATLEDEHSRLTQLKKRFEGSEDEISQEIQGFMGEFSDKDILEYIHSYAEKVNAGNERLIIRDISLSGDGVSDLGFYQAEISVSAVFSSEQTLFNFLNYATSQSGKYKFYITSFSYPMNQVGGNISVSIPLTLYYK